MGDVEREVVYESHRIHAAYLFGGGWAVFVVHSEARGAEMETVPGEYQTHEEALSVAKQYIEQRGEQQAP